jgi:hypothetical protein
MREATTVLQLLLNFNDVFLPSLEDRNRSSFQNIVFSCYLKFWGMDEVHKPSDECYALLSEPFRFITTFLVTFLEAGLFLNLHTISRKIEATCSFESSVSTHKSAWCNNPQNYNVKTQSLKT